LDNLELEVINILRELGIPAHIKGYRYIITAIKYLKDNPSAIYAMTKELYPGVSKILNEDIKGHRIERGIRHALSLSTFNDATWYRILGRTGPMTNTNFLATVVEAIKVKMASNPDKSEGAHP